MGMEVRLPEDIEVYLARNGGWLVKRGLSRLPDRALVEDAIQELVAYALDGIGRGRTFNSHYLGLRYQSLLRDARREWLRSLPASVIEAPDSLERQLDARRALARFARQPGAELVVDAIELGVAEAAARHGLSVGAVHVRMHRLRERFSALMSRTAA